MASILAQGQLKAVGSPCIKVAVGAGAAANADLVVTGITTDDTILALIQITQTTGAPVDLTQYATINDDDDVRSTQAFTNTTADFFLCLWHDASA